MRLLRPRAGFRSLHQVLRRAASANDQLPARRPTRVRRMRARVTFESCACSALPQPMMVQWQVPLAARQTLLAPGPRLTRLPAAAAAVAREPGAGWQSPLESTDADAAANMNSEQFMNVGIGMDSSRH